MKNRENKQVPEIRFKGFTDAWEQRKFGEVADIVGGGTPSTNIADYWNGNIDWYAPAEIGEQIFLEGSQKKITELGFRESSAKMLPVGTVLFTSRAGIGNTAILTKTGTTNQGFQSIVPHKSELDSYFIFSRTHELKRYGETVGAGSTFVEVSGKQMAKMPMLMPVLVEQKEIGDFFHTLDHLITLHQRKLEKTKDLKKAYLSTMFPTGNERKPKQRFKGFTDDWEQRKLGDIILEMKSGLSRMLSNEDIGLPVVRANNINDGILDLENDIKYWYKDDPQGAKTSNYFIHQDDLLVNFINSEAKMGTAALVCFEPKRKTIYTTNIMKLVPKDSTDAQFLFAITQTVQYNNYIKVITKPAVNQASFTTVDFKRFLVSIPSDKEQNMVGNFFGQFDHLITLHQRKLEKLQTLKKAYLSKMFV